MKTSGSLDFFGCELIIPNSSLKPMQNCSNAGRTTQGNTAQATSQTPRRGRRDFAVLCKRCRISWKLDIWKELNRTEFLSLSQNGKVRSRYLWKIHPPCYVSIFKDQVIFTAQMSPSFGKVSVRTKNVLVAVFTGKGTDVILKRQDLYIVRRTTRLWHMRLC